MAVKAAEERSAPDPESEDGRTKEGSVAKKKLILSFNPIKWSGELERHRDSIQQESERNTFGTLDEVPQWVNGESRQLVRGDVTAALRSSSKVRSSSDFAVALVDNAAILTYLCVALITPAFYLPNSSFGKAALNYLLNLVLGLLSWALAAAGFFALAALVALAAALFVARKRGIKMKKAYNEAYSARLTDAVAAAAMISIAYALMRMFVSEHWLEFPLTLRAAIMIFTLSTYALGIFVLLTAFADFGYALAIRHSQRRHPDGHLVVGLATYMRLTSAMPESLGDWSEDDRRKMIRKLEDLATGFKRDWPKRVRTGHLNADHSAQTWANGVAAALYEMQFPVLLAVGQRHGHSESIRVAVGNFLRGNRDAFPDDDDESARITAWWHRLGRTLAIFLTAAVALAFILVGLFQPELPDQLHEWGWPEVMVNRLRIGQGIQPQLLAVAAAFLGVGVKLMAPQVSTTVLAAGRRRLGR